MILSCMRARHAAAPHATALQCHFATAAPHGPTPSLRSLRAPTLVQECKDLCAGNPDCLHLNYMGPNKICDTFDGQCALAPQPKASWGNEQQTWARELRTVGPTHAWERVTNYAEGKVPGPKATPLVERVEVADRAECRSRCQVDADCARIVYERDTAGGTRCSAFCNSLMSILPSLLVS